MKTIHYLDRRVIAITPSESEAEYCERWSITMARMGDRHAANRWLALALIERWLALPE